MSSSIFVFVKYKINKVDIIYLGILKNSPIGEIKILIFPEF